MAIAIPLDIHSTVRSILCFNLAPRYFTWDSLSQTHRVLLVWTSNSCAEAYQPGFPILGVFRLKGQPEQDNAISPT